MLTSSYFTLQQPETINHQNVIDSGGHFYMAMA